MWIVQWQLIYITYIYMYSIVQYISIFARYAHVVVFWILCLQTTTFYISINSLILLMVQKSRLYNYFFGAVSSEFISIYGLGFNNMLGVPSPPCQDPQVSSQQPWPLLVA